MRLETLGKKLYYTTRDAISSRETIEFDDVTVTFPSYFVENFSWTIETERPVIEDLLASVRDGDSFYDIGAHAGLYSIAVGRAIQGEITAFEPYPPNVNRLNRYLRWNEVDIRIISHALSDSKTDTANLAGEVKTIDTKIGDVLVQEENIPKPDIVKIDVEGAELSVIRGIEENLPHCRLVYCEVHPDLLAERNVAPETISETLEGNGFTTEVIAEREQANVQPILRAEK